MVSNDSAERGLQLSFRQLRRFARRRFFNRRNWDCAPGRLIRHRRNSSSAQRPCGGNFPLAGRGAQKYSVPVKIDNDANAAALAEARLGRGPRHKNVFYLNIGTGLGQGLF